jgi:hypothetical protein
VTLITSRYRRVVPAVAALAFALGAAGCAGQAAHWISGEPAAAASGQAGGGTALPTPGDPTPVGTAAPQRVRIPDIDVDTVLEQLHLLGDGSLGTPSNFAEAGWYADGTRPGDTGPAVIAGHIDSTRGPAVFYRLDKLRAGALVEVLQDGRWLTFRVTEVARYPKNAFPTARVYGPTPDPQLRLITCGGAFDSARKSYLDNIVVYAVAA